MTPFSLAIIPVVCAAMAPLAADSMGNQKANQKTGQGTANGSSQMMMNQITPNAEPTVTHWADPFVTAEFIWWRAEEDNLDFAYSGVAPAVGVDAEKGHVHHPDFDYKPGFKVGAGLKFKHDGWDLYANYTWLRTDNEKEHEEKPNESQLYLNFWVPTQAAVVAPVALAKASAKWRLDFNVLDLELGRNYYISKRLTLRPFIGMKFSWNDQDFDVEYKFLTPNTDNVSEVEIEHDLDQFGVGIRPGLNTAWYMWKHWAITGNFALTGLWNSFHDKREDEAELATGAEFDRLHTKKINHSVTGVLEFALGLRFDTTFHDDDIFFFLQAAWENQIWFDQNQFFNVESIPPSNLSLTGLTVRTGLNF